MARHGKHKRGAPMPFVLNPPERTAAPARESWWLGASSREEFKEKHQAELPRIENSGFSKGKLLVTPPFGGPR